MKKLIFFAIALFIAVPFYSQNFEETEILPSINPTLIPSQPGYIAQFYHQSIFPFDVDGDGDLDLFYADHNDDLLKLMENNGENEFALIQDFGFFEEARMIEIVDSDNDGKIEVFVNSSSGLVCFEQMQGFNFGLAQSILNVEENRALIFGDFDGDADLDLVAGSKVYQNISNQEFILENDLGNIYHSQGISSDFDGDGLDDFVIAGLNYFENDGGFSFTQMAPSSAWIPSHLSSNVRAIDDLDKDGNLEVYYTIHYCGSDYCAGNIGGAEYSGTGLEELNFLGVNSSNPIVAPEINLSTSDFEGNGFLELDFSYFFNYAPPFQKGILSLNYGEEAQFENTSELFAIDKTPAYYVTEDFDGDGDEDMVIAYLDNQLTIVDNKRLVCDIDNFTFQPTGQNVSIDGNQATLEWDTYDHATKCQIKGNNDVFSNDLSFFMDVEPAQPLTFSKSFNLQPNTTYRWKVRCGCSVSPLMASDFSPYHYFTTPAFQGGESEMLLENAQSKTTSNEVRIWPNPSNGILQFSGIDDFNAIQIIDANGKTVFETALNNSVNQLDLSHLAQGNYKVMISNQNKIIQKNLILKNN